MTFQELLEHRIVDGYVLVDIIHYRLLTVERFVEYGHFPYLEELCPTVCPEAWREYLAERRLNYLKLSVDTQHLRNSIFWEPKKGLTAKEYVRKLEPFSDCFQAADKVARMNILLPALRRVMENQ